MSFASGLLQVRGHHVKQSCWLEFLRHFNLTRRSEEAPGTRNPRHVSPARWQHCKILTPAEQQSDGGFMPADCDLDVQVGYSVLCNFQASMSPWPLGSSSEFLMPRTTRRTCWGQHVLLNFCLRKRMLGATNL